MAEEPQKTQAEGEGEAKGSEEKKVGKFTHGDHMVHFFIQKGKKFVPPIEGDRTANVLIEVETNGLSEFAPCKDDVAANMDTDTTWGDHLFFEMRSLDPEDAKGVSITVKVMNKGFFKNEMIGIFQIEMSQVYFAKEHKIEHVWLALQNPDGEDASQVTGMLKISVSVQGPNDEQVKLEAEAGPEPKEPKMMMSASSKRTFNQMRIRLIEGREMPVFGTFSKTLECFVRMSYGGGRPIKSEPVDQEKGICPIMQEFLVPVQTPVVTDRMLLEIFDYGTVSDEQIGSLVLSIKKLMAMIQKNEGKPLRFWENIYGAPPDTSGDVADKMNDNPEMASHWRGRMLLEISSEECDKPKKGVEKLDPEVRDAAKEAGYYDDEEYEIWCEFGQGVALPKADEKYQVRLKVQDFKLQTTKLKEGGDGSKGNYIRWSERFEAQTFKLPYNGPGDDPSKVSLTQRVQLYLMDGDKPISWWKGKLCDFDGTDSKFRWCQLKSDRAIDKVDEDYQAGMVSIKLGIKKKGFDPYNFKSEKAWSSGPPRRMGAWKIRVFLFQCKEIPAADEDGTSDPFVKIWSCEKEKQQTKVVDDNLNPIFFETKDITYDFDEKENAPPIILEVFDSDAGLISDSADFLGRAVINLTDTSYTEETNVIPRPKWHDIKFGVEESAPACGSILVSFAIVADDATFEKEPKAVDLHEQVPTKEYKVSINVLGLRDLTPDGLLPIQKAYLKFMIKSLLDAEAAGTMQNIQTQPKERGASPNITTLIEFKVPLPEEKLFCPALAVTVFDQVFIGWSQPKLGNFTIPIGDIMHDMMDRRAFMLKQARYINKILEGVLDGTVTDLPDVTAEAVLKSENQAQGISAINNSDDEANEQDIQMDFEEANNAPQAKVEGEEKKADDKTGKKPKTKQDADLRDKQKQLQEQKKLEKIEAEKEQKRLAKEADTGGGEQTIKMPEYKFDKKLSVYREIDIPNAKVFLPVGFNDQDTIRAMMKVREGGLTHAEVEEKKQKADEKKSVKKVSLEMDEDEEEEARREAEVTALTKKHYRSFYNDELENNKEIFTRMPFFSYDIWRGQSRGAKKSSWFGGDNTDESGQTSTLTKCGYFKGSIDITNLADHTAFLAEKEEEINKIISNLKKIHEKVTGQPFDFRMEMLEALQSKNVFANVLENINCDFDGILEFLTEIQVAEMIKEQLTKKTDAVVQLYLLEGYDFASRDFDSPSDSYLIIECDTFKYDGRDEYQLDEANPQFNMRLEFGATFPGSKPIIIQAFDYDDIFGDDLIGKTLVDLDDRFFTPNWQALEEKPIEARQIYHPRTSLSQGVIRMWVDIEQSTKSTAGGKVWPISSEPRNTYEVRVAVFGAKNVPAEDVEGTSDAYIRAFFDEAKAVQETDTHYRNTDGKPNWNYRLLFDVTTPLDGPMNLKLQCWDRDLIKSNDLICQWQIDITQMIIDCQLTGTPIALQKKYYNESLKERMMASQIDGIEPLTWVKSDKEGNPDSDIILRAFHVDDKEQKKPIFLKLDIRVVPKTFGESNRVGAARGDPNVEPFLPEPEGRFKLSLNPFAMLNQLCAPSMRRKIWCCVCCIICIVACLYLIGPITAVIQLIAMAGS